MVTGDSVKIQNVEPQAGLQHGGAALGFLAEADPPALPLSNLPGSGQEPPSWNFNQISTREGEGGHVSTYILFQVQVALEDVKGGNPLNQGPLHPAS